MGISGQSKVVRASILFQSAAQHKPDKALLGGDTGVGMGKNRVATLPPVRNADLEDSDDATLPSFIKPYAKPGPKKDGGSTLDVDGAQIHLNMDDEGHFGSLLEELASLVPEEVKYVLKNSTRMIHICSIKCFLLYLQ